MKRLLSVCVVISILTGMYLYTGRAGIVRGCQEDPASPEIPVEMLTDSNVSNAGQNGAAGEKETGIDDFYGYYRITEFWPTNYYSALEFDALPIQEADMMIGRVMEIQEDILKTYVSVRRLGTREGRSAFPGNYNIETIYIEDPEYQWDAFTADVAWYEDYMAYADCESILKEYHDAIKGCISIQTTTPFGIQQYFVMDQGIIMVESLSGQLFFLEKLDTEPAESDSASYLTEEDMESVIHRLYGTYTVEEFLPTKFFPARDSSGDIRLPREEADMMVGQEIRIGEGNFITCDNFRLPNSKIVDRAMDEFLLEEVDIPDPDYQVTVKQRDEIYGLRDDMLPEDMVQEEYMEVNVFPGYYSNSERTLPRLYLLEDGRIIMYAMGEYFLLQKKEPYLCVEVENGYEVTLYDRSNEMVFCTKFPKEPGISRVTEDILEVSISVGSPAVYVFWFDTENAIISDTYFNPILVGGKYVAYMESNGELLLRDIFDEGLLEMSVIRNFSETADPMSAVMQIEMTDNEHIVLTYLVGPDYTKVSEKIKIENGCNEKGESETSE